jgi:hypothetical protein
VLPKFFNSINLLRTLAKVKEAAAVAKEALLGVTKSGDYKSTTFMPSKGIQYAL